MRKEGNERVKSRRLERERGKRRKKRSTNEEEESEK